MRIKRMLRICENKGCYKRVTNNVIYLRSENGNGTTTNIEICRKCFQQMLKEEHN